MVILSTLRKAILNVPLLTLYNRLRSVPLIGPYVQKFANRIYPRGSRLWMLVPIGTGSSMWMNLDPRYEMGYRTGTYETAVQRVLSQHLELGQTFYEVGAHIGFFSLLAADVVGETGEVAAFEPDPVNVDLIQQHFCRNSKRHAHVIPMAVWSKIGKIRFTRGSECSSHNAGGVLETSPWGFATDVIDVEAITLDDYSQTHRPPSFIKIDVEGAELHVLMGAQGLLTRYKPLVLCEVHTAELRIQVEQWLIENSYAVEWFMDQPDLARHLIARPNPAGTLFSGS